MRSTRALWSGTEEDVVFLVPDLSLPALLGEVEADRVDECPVGAAHSPGRLLMLIASGLAVSA
jgi:hypothetical protein